MRKEKQIRYMVIKDGCIDVEYSDDFIKTMKEEFRCFFDTTDNLFMKYPDIRVFVKDESLWTDEPSVFYCQDHKLMMTFNGTVFFAKLGNNCVRSLSKKEVSFLLKNLSRNDDGTYSIDAEA